MNRENWRPGMWHRKMGSLDLTVIDPGSARDRPTGLSEEHLARMDAKRFGWTVASADAQMSGHAASAEAAASAAEEAAEDLEEGEAETVQ